MSNSLVLRHIDVDIHDGVADVAFNKDIWISCFTEALLDDFMEAYDFIAKDSSVRFQVIRSLGHGVFSLGGDLRRFIQMRSYDGKFAVMQYATKCIDLQHRLLTGYTQPVTTIALIQGMCLGGGFELALGNQILIAENHSTFCFPETQYGLFPGMGAVPLLTHRVGPKTARAILGTTRTLTANELGEMGVLDASVAEGTGQDVVDKLIGSMNYGHRRLLDAFDQPRRVSYDELRNVAYMWVDAVMNMTPRQVALMQRVNDAQG